MATLVQQPELAQVQQSNLQATPQVPETEHNLSDFALGLLSKANKFKDDYDKENANRLIALGVSDHMNDYTREVSWLDRKGYEQGRTYASMVSAQTQRRQEFQKRLDELKTTGLSEQEIFEFNKEFLQATVNDIYESDLDPDLKEKLYQNTIQENMQYQKLISEQLRAVAIDNYTKTARLTGAQLLHELQTLPLTDEETVEKVKLTLENLEENARTSQYASTEEEAYTAASNTIKGAFNVWFEQIDQNAPDAAESLNRLRRVSDSLYNAGYMDLSAELVKKVNAAQAKVLSNNEQQLDRDFILQEHNFKVGAIDLSAEEISQQFNELAATGLYGESFLNDWYQRMLNVRRDLDEKILAGQDDDNILEYDNYYDFELDTEQSRDKWLKAVYNQAKQTAIATGSGTMTGVANQLIMRQAQSDKYMPELLDKAMELSTAELASWMNKTPQQLREEGVYEAYEQSWRGLVQSYQYLESTNPIAAERMLQAIPEDLIPNKLALKKLLQTGTSLAGAKEALSRPVEMKHRVENLNRAREKMNLDNAGLDNWIFTGRAGSFGVGTRADKPVREVILNNLQLAASKHDAVLEQYMHSDSPEALLNAMDKANILIYTDFQPVVVEPQFGAMVASGRMKDSKGRVLSKDHFARAIDAHKTNLAKRWGGGVKPANIVATQNGDSIDFMIFDKDGNIMNTTGVYGVQGSSLSLSQLLNDAGTIRELDEQRARKKTVEVKRKKGVLDTVTSTFGEAIADTKTYTVRPTATLGKGTLRVHGTGKIVPVKYPVSMARPFGNNRGVTLAFADAMNRFEGWSPKATFSKAQGGTSSVSQHVIGWGITKRYHKATFAKMQAAKTEQERLNIQSDYLGAYFKVTGFKDAVKAAGLPELSTKAVPPSLENAYVLIADGAWHGGGGGSKRMAEVLGAKDVNAALSILRNSKVYKGIKSDKTGKHGDHPRNRWREQAVIQYFQYKNMLSGRGLTVPSRGFSNAGNITIPYRIK